MYQDEGRLRLNAGRRRIPWILAYHIGSQEEEE